MPTYNATIDRSGAQALMPEEVSNSILEGLTSQSAALTLFTHVTMSRLQTRMPVLATLPHAYWVSGDTGLKQTTKVDWKNKYLNAEELAVIVPIPEAVLDDTAFDVWATIRPLVEQEIGRTLDAAVFFGHNKPASWPDSIVDGAVAAGNEVDEGTNAAAEGGLAGDFSDLFQTVETEGYDVNGILLNRVFRGKLRQVRTTFGQELNEVSPNNVYGITPSYPMRGLWPSGGQGVAEAIAGDFSQGIVGVRQDITYKMLDQSVITDENGAILYNFAQQDAVGLRVVARFAFQVANTIRYDQPDESLRYPFATLNGLGSS